MSLVESALVTALKPFGYKVVKKPGSAARSECPSVLLITLPKSGSMFLHNTLSINLELESIQISPGYFPVDYLDLSSVLEFANGGYIAAAHINPSPFNLNLLSRFCEKCVVHVRDPRAAVLSWTHHKDRPEVYQNPKVALRNFPLEPDSYYSSMSFSEKIDWQIENHLPQVIHWIDEWGRVVDSPTYAKKIVMTNHEQLAGRDVEFIQELISSLGLRGRNSVELAKKDMSSHFRTGSKDEWRSAFTPAQIEKASKKIPSHLINRFGWVKI